MRYEKNNAEGGNNNERRLVRFVWNAWPIVVIVRLWHLLVVIWIINQFEHGRKYRRRRKNKRPALLSAATIPHTHTHTHIEAILYYIHVPIICLYIYIYNGRSQYCKIHLKNIMRSNIHYIRVFFLTLSLSLLFFVFVLL